MENIKSECCNAPLLDAEDDDICSKCGHPCVRSRAQAREREMPTLEQHLKQLEAAEQLAADFEAGDCPACGKPVWAHGHFHDEIICASTEPHREAPGTLTADEICRIMQVPPRLVFGHGARRNGKTAMTADFVRWYENWLFAPIRRRNRQRLHASRSLKPGKYRALLRRTYA